ncbi:hypothetical protein RRG08_033458 [Elysia crispata]|uniref:Uncharacterized protein n=1 Tax=Elysia crispata TaxID=231223 RepID=A0AAE1AV53_9GAST|nr:hypothetical protein RRG08_033458 [Elysia crispata]
MDTIFCAVRKVVETLLICAEKYFKTPALHSGADVSLELKTKFQLSGWVSYKLPQDTGTSTHRFEPNLQQWTEELRLFSSTLI